jgi:hypothetical protein
MSVSAKFLAALHAVRQIVYWADVFFTTIFTIEAILKIIAWRFTSYIVQGQNIVDFIGKLTCSFR